ncbi:MAG: pyridoxamine 5'-phosphate oxidase family protein [Fervidobacterium sp.]|uniref:Nitroimidazol reductase NimA, pyridoxamine 5'-phosphate oxidase superfamily n=1 Tax=Fervidobacterium gondwanense DSM 13020 TaxID=1121883 RepID=A0A1M7SW88_FERGO|nr:pyridoxamine 5'-phosphate oxidase family protein [Fervidobacterium gondwanense]SHN62712.1 Nitroimidazol reductase NimA, pyridoxamine 5'-phosphate oxidase superfamily [Fervidobacterium gondwanense DSM 13020]
MPIEREKKYLIDENQATKLKNMAKFSIGVVQWYLPDCILLLELLGERDFSKSREWRIRYTVDKKGNETWIAAFKSELVEGFQRVEEEYDLTKFIRKQNTDMWERLFNELSSKPVVVKIRHYISDTPTEIVLDEFMQLDIPYNIDIKYMVEIETEDEFEKYEKEYDLGEGISTEEFDIYTNRNIAIESQIPPRVLITLVKQALGISPFPKMRRKDRELPIRDAIELLKIGEYGFFTTYDGNYPYAVPVNYVYKDGAIYFHCASSGKKLENISVHKNVSFSVVTKAKVLPEQLSTAYESVIAFGQARVVDGEKKKMALLELVRKYSPQTYGKFTQSRAEEFESECSNTTVVKLIIEYITGKRRNE